MSSLAGREQPVPPGWRTDRHTHRFVTPAPRSRVWAWLGHVTSA